MKNTITSSREWLRGTTRRQITSSPDVSGIRHTIYTKHLKRVFDVTFAVLAAPLLMPFFLVAFFVTRSDGGPVFFQHTRIGRHGKEFKCLKIRTMCVDAEKVLDDLLKTDMEAREEWYQHFKLKNDPRITNFGKFMRMTSMDELPQIFNVILGQMSIVGPRPITREELERFGSDARYYTAVRPGITGPWQTQGRRHNDLSSRRTVDVEYVKSMSFAKDVYLIFATIPEVVFCHGK